MLPNTPTDSLYKFLAVGGLLLAGFSVWIDREMTTKLKSADIAAKDQYIDFVNEIESRYNAIAAKDNKKNPDLKLLIMVPTPDGTGAHLTAGIEFSLVLEGEHRSNFLANMRFWGHYLYEQSCSTDPIFKHDKLPELRSKLRVLSASVEQLWRQADLYNSYRRLTGWGLPIGPILSVIGFFFWYRNQRRSDETEKLELLIMSQSDAHGNTSIAMANDSMGTVSNHTQWHEDGGGI